jgi:hypothetical protein
MQTARWSRIFQQCIHDYHEVDNVNAIMNNPYTDESLDFLMYKKNWIDTVQWHLEDVIRDPEIAPAKALEIKRRIDSSNQERTEIVEWIDNRFLEEFSKVVVAKNARYNTESPAWAIDRLSILELKIFHMAIEASRKETSGKHSAACREKLNVLLTQRNDLSTAIDELLHDIASGRKYMKLYKQMKMYNDKNLNPILYQHKNGW